MTGRKKAPRGLPRVVYVRVTVGMHEALAREARRRAKVTGEATSGADVAREMIAAGLQRAEPETIMVNGQGRRVERLRDVDRHEVTRSPRSR